MSYKYMISYTNCYDWLLLILFIDIEYVLGDW